MYKCSNFFSAATARRLIWIMPVIFGLISLSFGQDSNWDLQNYHLYNPYALLNNRVGFDLAPAGFQSYFSPMIDVPAWLLYRYLPAPAVGFLMGLFHGLCYPLLYKITQAVLPAARIKVLILLSIAGCLTANFLSSLGNGMGDVTTAVFVLAGIYSALLHLNQPVKPGNGLRFIALSGLLLGLAAGLKLTNIVFCAALFFALLMVKRSLSAYHFRSLIVFSLSTLAGLLLIDGYWLWKMWDTFGNPLFPQMNSVFKSDLVGNITVMDQSWRPKTLTDFLLWPFIFTFNAKKVGQINVIEPLWIFGYILTIAFAASRLLKGVSVSLAPGKRLILWFTVTAYLLWMGLFSIFRYVVPMEMLLPLLCYFIASSFSHKKITAAAAIVILFSSLFSVFRGSPSWGHEKWHRSAFRVEQPAVSPADSTVVVLIGGDPVYGWLIPSLPPSMRFTQVASNFPETPEYMRQQQTMVTAKGSQEFAIIPASTQKDYIINNHNYIVDANKKIISRGWHLDTESCKVYSAYMGKKYKPYQFCRVLVAE